MNQADSTKYKTLTDLAKSSADLSLWNGYTQYLIHKDNGLRQMAFQQLNDFIDTLGRADFREKIKFIDWLCTVEFYNGDDLEGHLPEPLRRKLVEPTIEEWLNKAPNDPIPYRWKGTKEALIKSIRLDPQEQIARLILLRNCIAHVSMSQHELHASYGYIGDPEADLEYLNLSISFCKGLENELKEKFKLTLQGLKTITQDYIEFRQSKPDETVFFNWLKIVKPAHVKLL